MKSPGSGAGASRVLELLRRASDRPCSGESLSSALGVSRTQIWKHVELLRARGYTIEGEAGGGYRLTRAPDRLYPDELRSGLATRWLAQEIHYFESTDSTNRVALELARGGTAHGAMVVAEGQTRGRGRLGRSFYSPPFRNLYTSIVLRPTLTTAEAPTLILASAIAVADCVADEVADDDAVEIKWPNDVLLEGRKTSGILMEMAAEATRVDFLVLGIAVNLNVDRATFPAEFRERATSIASATGRPVDRIRFTQRLCRALEEVLDLHASKGFDGLRSRFEARFRMEGRAVRVHDLGGGERRGVVRGIASDGALLFETHSGALERVVAGDVTLSEEGGRA